MLGPIRRPWYSFAVWLSACWGRLQAKSQFFPVTNARMENMCDAIVASIDRDKVCDFVSRHSNGMACAVLEMNRGSYNISIHLGFFGVIPDRLLRIPLRPTVRDSWTKIQSEVATLESVRENTAIPVPRVWAYGKDAQILKDPCQAQHYLLCDYMPGQCLTQRTLKQATSEQRIELFSQLIGIYAQLYSLEFPFATSLLPRGQLSSPCFSRLLTMARNELHLSAGKSLSKPQILQSTNDFIQHQLGVLSGFCRRPLINSTLADERERVFAHHHIQLELDTIKHCVPSSDGDPFVLTHPDMHYGNIVVNKGLNIVGIIDWEFSGTVPR
ncbi:phosphotransferase [Cordyceps javanica]|uniref:Phosphotransferase n=1 Tax=Cordyceps javanica TaxID=43265 RepID=A0A545V7Q5_9HYPO|nr:phosphotransferase [Cordyceps javanica]